MNKKIICMGIIAMFLLTGLSNFSITVKADPPDLCEALDNCDLEWTTLNNAWYAVELEDAYGGDAAQCDDVYGGILNTIVDGPGTISFFYNTTCDNFGDGYIYFFIRDAANNEVHNIKLQEEEFVQYIYEVENSGQYKLIWQFYSFGEDEKAWVDNVEWENVPSEPNEPPIAIIDSISPNPADEGEWVTLKGHGSDSDGTINGYNWRSSIDGELSTGEDYVTSELSLGDHTIYYKVKDNEGEWSAEVSSSLTIIVPNIRPIANYIWHDVDDTDSGYGPSTEIEFDASESYDPEGGNLEYQWWWDIRVNSGNIGNLPVPDDVTPNPMCSHDYGDCDNHQVLLKVKDDSDERNSGINIDGHNYGAVFAREPRSPRLTNARISPESGGTKGTYHIKVDYTGEYKPVPDDFCRVEILSSSGVSLNMWGYEMTVPDDPDASGVYTLSYDLNGKEIGGIKADIYTCSFTAVPENDEFGDSAKLISGSFSTSGRSKSFNLIKNRLLDVFMDLIPNVTMFLQHFLNLPSFQ